MVIAELGDTGYGLFSDGWVVVGCDDDFEGFVEGVDFEGEFAGEFKAFEDIRH